jgi:hypothetical protein
MKPQTLQFAALTLAITYNNYVTYGLLKQIEKDVKFQRETIESVTGLYKSLASRESTRRS